MKLSAGVIRAFVLDCEAKIDAGMELNDDEFAQLREVHSEQPEHLSDGLLLDYFVARIRGRQ